MPRGLLTSWTTFLATVADASSRSVRMRPCLGFLYLVYIEAHSHLVREQVQERLLPGDVSGLGGACSGNDDAHRFTVARSRGRHNMPSVPSNLRICSSAMDREKFPGGVERVELLSESETADQETLPAGAWKGHIPLHAVSCNSDGCMILEDVVFRSCRKKKNRECRTEFENHWWRFQNLSRDAAFSRF